MDEHIFDPVTYALLKSQLKTDNIQNDSEDVTGEDLTEVIDNLNNAIIDAQNYKSGDIIDVFNVQVVLSNTAGTFIEMNVPTPRKIPNNATFTVSTINEWIRKFSDGSDVTGYNVSALRQTDHWLTLKFTMESASLEARTPYVVHFKGNVVIA